MSKNEEEKDQWFELGKITGRVEIFKELYDRAAGLFRGHNDKEAIEIRRLALQLELDTKQMRENYNAKYHQEEKI